MGLAKYDHFFTRNFYGYLGTKAERDGVADLEVRVAPGAGVGYQWFESRTFNLSNELGVVWVYENYTRGRSSEFFGPRLAYSVDWTPIEPLLLYHKLEYIPSFKDFSRRLPAQHRRGGPPGGVEGALRRAALRVPLRRDAGLRPSPSTDQRYILGAGFSF